MYKQRFRFGPSTQCIEEGIPLTKEMWKAIIITGLVGAGLLTLPFIILLVICAI